MRAVMQVMWGRDQMMSAIETGSEHMNFLGTSDKSDKLPAFNKSLKLKLRRSLKVISDLRIKSLA